jgi:hypothetical protein
MMFRRRRGAACGCTPSGKRGRPLAAGPFEDSGAAHGTDAAEGFRYAVSGGPGGLGRRPSLIGATRRRRRTTRPASRTSRLLCDEFPTLQSRLPMRWSRSYFAPLVGAVSKATIRRYIASQKGG